MAQAIIRFPNLFSRSALKCLGAVVTFILAFYCYASGQIAKSGSANRSGNQTASLLAALRGAVPALEGVTPDYGITPLYGIEPLYGVVEYGMPYANFGVKGAIRQEANEQPIPGIRVMLKDTASKAVLVDDTTDAQGGFSLELASTIPVQNTWILQAQDVDGILNGGAFGAKDTLVTIPLDSLKGGSGFFLGRAEAAVEMLLKKNSTIAGPAAGGASEETSNLLFTQRSSANAEIRFAIAAGGRVRLRAYDAGGALAADLFDGSLRLGAHALRFDVSRFPAGAYFFRLDSNGVSRVLKATLHR